MKYIKDHVRGKKPTSSRPKPVPTGLDFVRMVHFLYAKDATRYPSERQRLQQAFLIIVHALSGLRPSSTTRPSKKKTSIAATESGPETDDFARLRYKDLVLLVARTEKGIMRFAIRPTFRCFKGQNNRLQRCDIARSRLARR